MKWSVGMKIGCMNAVAICVLILVSLCSFYSTDRMSASMDARQNSYKIISQVNLLLTSLVDAETGQRGYFITNQEGYLEPYHSALSAISKNVDTLKKLAADNINQQHNINILEPLIANKLANIQQSLKLNDAAQKIASQDAGKKIMDEIRRVIKNMTDEENELLTQRIKDSNDSINTLFDIIILGTLFAVIFLIVFGVILTRNIAKPLQAMTTAAKLLSTSVNSIFSSISQLVASGSETAAAVNETTSTIEEVKQTSQLTSQKAKLVSESAQQVAQTSKDGKKSIQATSEGMIRIQDQMEAIAESMMRLSEQTQAISSIIESVDDLAQQSNLLAVNASIEAEKAGEQGGGFRIVAQEIKSLADQSKQATHRVREILSDVQKATSTAVLATEEGHKVVNMGVKKSEKTSESISTLSNSISDAAQAAIQIAASSQQQLIGVEQAAIAMINIKQASLQNVDIAKQLETSANKLKDLGIELEGIIDKNKI
jgi:methyl-accepting chemotaxis protein